MYYDIDSILREELEAVNYLLDNLEVQDDGSMLMVRPCKKEFTYHRRFVVVGEDGERQRHSEKLGNERHPKVIEMKQQKFNQTLKRLLEEAKSFLEDTIGKYKGYDMDVVEEALPAVYRDTTGLVNKDPVLMTAEEWSRRPYKRNRYPYGPEANVNSKGERVRSKSEVILHDQLTFLGIPFQSDVDISLIDESGAKIHKDADYLIGTIHGKKPVLEHLGMLSNQEYRDKAMKKLELYINNGYTLNKDLFLTADNRDGKINAYATMQLLRRMILPKTRT